MGCFNHSAYFVKGVCMDTAVSFLLLFIFAVMIFGVPVLLIAIRLIDTISEWRESARRAEGESTAEEKLERSAG